jgi:hypothetical protein
MQSACVVLYCYLWPAQLYYIFPHKSHKSHDFRKKLLNIKCVSIFSATLVWNISHSKKNSARQHKCAKVFMWSTRFSCRILLTLEFSRQIFEKYLNLEFHENPSSGSRVIPCWRTDMTELIVAFRNFANAPKNMNRNNECDIWMT